VLRCGVAAPVSLESIERRVHIREAIMQGNIRRAIDLVNEVDAGVCTLRVRV
jgi:hypothetical protein